MRLIRKFPALRQPLVDALSVASLFLLLGVALYLPV
jgi:hypothetical protein